MDTTSYVIALLTLDSLLFISLFVIAYYGYFIYKRLEKLASIVSAMDSFNLNLARDLGNRFANVDDALSGEVDNRFNDVDNALNHFRQQFSEVYNIVSAFKNDLITQVRLSREDYEELIATAESKREELLQPLNDLRLAQGTLQAQLVDFRNKFDTFTAD